MFGNERKPKILKNRNGDTSVRLKSNVDIGTSRPNETNPNNKNRKPDQ